MEAEQNKVQVGGTVQNSNYERKPQKVKLYYTLLLVVVCFLMLLAYWNQPFFETDEGEIFLLGHTLARGRLLYRDAVTQHMPVMHYIAALFSLFGASTVLAYRICFYLLMSIFWGIMFYRYSNYIGRRVMILYPLIYIACLVHFDYGHTIVSEQFQGIGMMILLFELLIFEKRRELDTGNIVMIAIAVFISFGSAFVSVFSIFFLALTVLTLELVRYKKENIGIISGIAKFACSYWKLLFAAAPLIVLAAYYLLTGTWDDFYNWAYKMNREGYSRYIGGYGDSIPTAMFAGVSNIAWYIVPSELSAKSLAYTAMIAGAVYFLLYIQQVKKNTVLTIGIILLWIGSATRGLFSFHGLPAIALLSVMDAFAVDDLINHIGGSIPRRCAVLFLGVALTSSYIQLVPNLLSVSFDKKTDGLAISHSEVINLLTDENEVVGFSTHNYQVLFESHAVPSPVNAGYAWYWDWGGEKAMKEYMANPPRLFMFDPGYATSGYHITEYAADLCSFIAENYISLSGKGYAPLYVRKDYFSSACEILDSEYRNQTGKPCPVTSIVVSEDAATMNIMFSDLNDYEAVLFAVWSEDNGQDDLHWYDAHYDSDEGWTYEVDLRDFLSAGDYTVHIYGRNGEDIQILRTESAVVPSLPTESASIVVSEDMTTMNILFSDPNDYEAVLFAVWSEDNGQDDLHWYDAHYDSDEGWTYEVDLRDFLSAGDYAVHIYGRNGEELRKLRTESAEVTSLPAESASIVVSEDAATMNILFSDLNDYEAVLFAVWSEDNGQDDLHWYDAHYDSDEGWTYEVDLRDFLSAGDYAIHIYGRNGEELRKLRMESVAVASLPTE